MIFVSKKYTFMCLYLCALLLSTLALSSSSGIQKAHDTLSTLLKNRNTDMQHYIDQAAAFAREQKTVSSGHDWWHTYRVWQMAKKIHEHEGGNILVIELAALLHGIDNHKFHNGDLLVGAKTAQAFLESIHVPKDIIESVYDIVATCSFKGAADTSEMKTLEGNIVQDADRLDAMGAMGIARTFAYAGYKNHAMYDPEKPYKQHASFEEYSKNDGSAINHFYEKLLVLKDRLNTKTARAIAEKRHAYMEEFLEQFYGEWEATR